MEDLGSSTQNLTTLERWDSLWEASGVKNGPTLAEVYNKLMAMYAEDHRKYHNAAHVSACLKEFDSVKGLFKNPVEAEMAIWFHDAIYDTRRSDNEAKSAEFAYSVAKRAGLSEQSARRISEHILATEHKGVIQGHDSNLIIDIDIAILGKTPQIFDAYERMIREEYAWMPEERFRRGRAGVLNSFLDKSVRPNIYLTDTFRERYEEQAKSNLHRSLEKLNAN